MDTRSQEEELKNTPQTPAGRRIAREAAAIEPGSRRAKEIERADAQQSMGDNASDGFKSTAAYGVGRVVGQEAEAAQEDLFGDVKDRNIVVDAAQKAVSGVMVAAGYRAKGTPFKREEKYEELTKDIPYEYHDEIMDNEDSYEAAMRARVRIQDDLKRGQRIAQQDAGTLTVLAASLVDVDLPMVLMSGGAYGSAKVARSALKASKIAGLSPRAATRVAGIAQGANAGLQAGVVVGAVDAKTRETTEWTDVAAMAFQSAMLGGTLGGAFKGDVRVSMKAAQDEFMSRVAKDDPTLTNTLDVEAMANGGSAITLEARTPMVLTPEQRVEFDSAAAKGSIGASQTGPSPTPQPKLVDPAGTISDNQQGWIDAARDANDVNGFNSKKDAVADEWWAKVATSGYGSFGANNFITLYNSKSSVANWMAHSLFESPTGLGRGNATAATRMENYHRRIQQSIVTEVQPAMNSWAKKNGHTFMGSGYGANSKGGAAFNREVMLELNERSMGRPDRTGLDGDVRRAADAYEKAGFESLNIGRGRDGEMAVDGFDAIKDRRGYTPYVWNGRRLLELEQAGTVERGAIEQALADGYTKAGMGVNKDARVIAKAVIARAVARQKDVDTSLMSLLSGDGREWLMEAIQDTKMSKAEAEGLMQRLDGAAGEKGKEGFAKMRNEIDMNAAIATKDGSDLRVVDLLDNDMHGVWQRYSRRMSGSAALARQGITNRAQRKEVISAMQAEQRALGEEAMDGDLMEAMLSNFNGGPVFGFSRGNTNEGVGAEIATAKRMTNIALLEALGLTQLAETGATMAQNGVMNWATRGPMAVFNKELKAGNRALLDDMAYVTGRIGDDHKHFATHLDLDDVSTRDKADWLRTVSKLASNAQWVQGYTSLFNQVRTFQQTTAALGMADKVMRTLKKHIDDGTPFDSTTAARFESDLGLDRKHLSDLEDLIRSGAVSFKEVNGHTFVERLNMDTWDAEIGEVFGSSITRNINQLVQKSMAGEQDAWMHTAHGTVLTHLKTFPMQAIQKQVLRNARHTDMQSVNTLMMGLATAYVAVRVKDAISGKERTEAEYAKAAFNYSNMTGFIPMVADPLMTIVGLEDYRFNKYGPYSSVVPPMFSVANDMRRVPGALWHTATGNSDYEDQQALKAIPFAGTYGVSRAFD